MSERNYLSIGGEMMDVTTLADSSTSRKVTRWRTYRAKVFVKPGILIDEGLSLIVDVLAPSARVARNRIKRYIPSAIRLVLSAKR